MKKLLLMIHRMIDQPDNSDVEVAAMQSLRYPLGSIFSVIAVLWMLFHLYTMGFGLLPSMIQRSIHLGGALILCFALYTAKRNRSGHELNENAAIPVFDWLLIVLASISCLYIIINYDAIVANHGKYTLTSTILGIILLLIVLEGARRTFGWVIPVLLLLVLFYAFFGKIFPGIWAHPGVDFRRFIAVFYLSTQGIWGQLTAISTNTLVVFVLYGALIFKLGLGETFLDLGKKLTGRLTGGAAQLATVVSAFFGTINGSAVANVATVGSITIPMMRRLGYDRNFAGGVEATASSGGQIMPPVMGAGAFIMAELLGLPYYQVMIAAIVPAVLFYFSINVAIFFYARKHHLRGVPKEEIPSWKQVLDFKKIVPLFIPLAAMVWLMVRGFTAGSAGFWACVLTVVLHAGMNIRDMASLKAFLKQLYVCMDAGAKSMVSVVMLIGVAQALVTAINTSGLGVKFSSVMIAFSQGYLLIALVLAMMITIILGMGAPTPAAYVLAASVVGSALIGFGMDPLQAHMFLYYYASLAAITPPVCAAVFVAVGISGGNWLKTAWYAIRLSIVAFIIPYIFAYNPVLLMNGSAGEILLSFLSALIGTVIIAIGTMGEFLIPTNWYERLLAFVSALFVIWPGVVSDAVGLGLFAFLLLSQLIRRRQTDPYYKSDVSEVI